MSESLSAVVRVGDDLWVGADEGVEIARLEPTGRAGAYAAREAKALAKRLDLPADESEEADIEGMDWQALETNLGYLWLVGSHSLKRKKAEATDDDGKAIDPEENVAELEKPIKSDGNRYLLARLPVQVDGERSELLKRSEYAKDFFAAQLPCTDVTSDLLNELRDDPLLSRFIDAELPGKENGFDIEGLAHIDGGRLLVGLRGPVLRGMAVVLEIEVDAKFAGKGATGSLKLKKIGPDGRRYLRHFLDLGGLGIRDLCFHGNDLLVLAGPTMPIDYPAMVFAWRDARRQLGQTERFAWPALNHLQLVVQGPEPREPGHDRAEGILLWDEGQRSRGLRHPFRFASRRGAAAFATREGNPAPLTLTLPRFFCVKSLPALVWRS